MRKNNRINEIFYINRNDKLALCWVAKSTHKANDYGGYKLRKSNDVVWYFRYVALDGFSLPSYRAFKTKTEALAYQTRFLDRRDLLELNTLLRRD